MDSTKIKEAFTRAKQDIHELRSHLEYISFQLEELKRTLQQTNQQTNQQENPTNQQTPPLFVPTNLQIIPTDTPTHSNTPTDNLPPKDLKTPFSEFSSRNKGVPTDRQTDQQTDRHIFSSQHISSSTTQQPSPSITHVSHLIDSLDEIKQQLRQQFKSLTTQEMLIFSTIYQLEEEDQSVDYPLLASRLHLSESSIRDYVLKLTKKGIPLNKTKENNKKVRLNIPSELKRMASLQTLLTLREL